MRIRGCGVSPQAVPAASSRAETDLKKAVLEELRETGVRALINVVVSDGAVHLWGAVESDAEKDALEVAASNTPGVGTVVNHVGVYPQIVGGAV